MSEKTTNSKKRGIASSMLICAGLAVLAALPTWLVVSLGYAELKFGWAVVFASVFFFVLLAAAFASMRGFDIDVTSADTDRKLGARLDRGSPVLDKINWVLGVACLLYIAYYYLWLR